MENNEVGNRDVVVDLMGFMVETNMATAVSQLGVYNILGSLLGGSNPQNLEVEFLKLLKKINPQQPPQSVIWKGKEAPYLLYEFLTSKRSAAEILASAENSIRERNPKNRELMLKCAKMAFDPVTNTKIMCAVPGVSALLNRLHNADNTIHVLANWNAEAAQHLIDGTVIKNEVTYIDGEITVSGKLGMVKSLELYQKYLEEEVELKNPIFIETQQQYIEQLHQANPDIPTILHTGNFKQTKQKLIELGALPPE